MNHRKKSYCVGVYKRLLLPGFLLLVGCWPARRSELPELFFRVEDSVGKPVRARVVILSASEPHSRIWKRLEVKTNKDGILVVQPTRVWRLEGLSTHGIPHYYLAWCISGPGFVRRLGVFHRMPESAQVYVTMVASTDASVSCSQDSVVLAAEAMSGLK